MVAIRHLGAPDSRMLPRLLDLYKRYGFRFVTLEEATRDPSLRPDLQRLRGPILAKALPLPSNFQRPPLDTMCR